MKKTQSFNETTHILVKGAKEHNLRNVSINLPKKKLIVFTGVSGSGKSSLAFDTIFAEGQRRYIESLSSYARQFLGQMEKPKYDMIKGLSPTISIDQKSANQNPRSTVGTITEIYDYLRVLYARVGTQYCHHCGKKVGSGDSSTIVDQILSIEPSTKIHVLAPLVTNRKGEHKDTIQRMESEGYSRLRVDGIIASIGDIGNLAKQKKHDIEVVVDRLVIKSGSAFRTRLTDSVETALKLGNGNLILHIADEEKDMHMSEKRSCCDYAFPELEPPIFSFNSPQGMCPECNGLGTVLAMDEDKIIPDKSISIREGAIVPWKNYFVNGEDKGSSSWGASLFLAMEKQWKIDFSKPWSKMPKKHRDLVLHGSKEKELTAHWKSEKIEGSWTRTFEGLLNTLMRRYLQTKSDGMKSWYGKFMSSRKCESCHGRRLKPQVLSVKISDHSIIDIGSMTISEAHKFITGLKLSKNEKLIANELIKEISNRLKFLINVGLPYLSLNRKGPTLSGGEAQRIRLASQIGSELTGVLYILDEPSIGLHQRDNKKLLKSLHHLRDIGNTLIVVEHDQETIESSDWVVDIGPGAGHLGGRVVFKGTVDEMLESDKSLTGKYLSGKDKIPVPKERRKCTKRSGNWITIRKASANNLKNVDVSIPQAVFTAVTGVSGAGKSTLINQILYPALAHKINGSDILVGEHKSIEGIDSIEKVVNIDQKPIGRTPRSNPATYTKVFDLIRDFYALLPESKMRGYNKGRFSFNVKGGRCEHCKGDGFIKVEMHFLADVFVPCEICHGRRFNSSTLEVTYKGSSIADILDMTVSEALDLFKHHKRISAILSTLVEVGLSYVKLGQPATTLSGGEAQRIKLARELAKREHGKSLYILDEPTTGLHFQDIKNLLIVLHRLVDAGNTVVVIEHNLDVIKTADWILDLGPEGGDLGGEVIAEGSPEKVAKVKKSFTGQFLKKML